MVVINADPCSRPQRTVLEVGRINGNSSQLHVSTGEFRGLVDAQILDCNIYPRVWRPTKKPDEKKKEVKQSTVSLDGIPVRLLTGILIISRTTHLELNRFDLIRLLLRSNRELESD